MVKRRRKCGGCGSCFHRIDTHHAHSPECAGPCPTGSVPASHPIDLIHDLEEDDTLVHNDEELPDDLPALLSTNNSTTAENDSSSQRMDVDDDDLCEMFIADCNTPSLSHIPLPLASAGSQSNPANSPVLATTSLPDQPTGVASAFDRGPLAPPVGLESGRAFSVQPDHQKARHCFTNQDRSLMKLYHIFDEADSPRYLCDKVLAQLKEEMTRHNFEPNNPLLTKRNPFMARMHRKFPSPPPEAVMVQLETFESPITIYRFDAMQQLQAHLLRQDLYGNLDKLNVNPDDRWDQSVHPCSTHLREVTDSPWFKDKVAEVNNCTLLPDDLVLPRDGSQHIPFLFPVEQYQDATGNDNKESSSLEPVMIGSGLLKSSFNGDHRSRFIIGYIPCLTKKKATPGKRKKKFGASVRDYHKCMSILMEPLVQAQKDPPLLDMLLGDQVRRVQLIVVMAVILGDGKSTDMLCGRVMSHTNTLRLSRATFTPSDSAEETGSEQFNWIKSIVIERVTRAALFDVTCTNDMRSLWNSHLHTTVRTKTQRGRHISAANRRTRICKEILKKALGSHAVINAFFPLDFGSDYGVFGHTFSDLMHVLEEGIFKYLLSVFLDPLSDAIAGNLDDLATKLLGPKANRCHGMRSFPRVNFTRGFTRLTLLSSEERVGALLALVLLLQTDKGQAILEDRFSPGFDARRMSRAAQFLGGNNRNNNNDEDMEPDDEADDEADDEDDDEDETETVDDDIDLTHTAGSPRVALFRPTHCTIHFVCAQIGRHDLSFLHQDVFPNLPARHVLECMKIIWKHTWRLSDCYDIVLPPGCLNLPPFRARPRERAPTTPFSAHRLCCTFGADWERQNNPPLGDEAARPTITNDQKEFVLCCERLLTLRSFYNYGGEHCPTAIPWKLDGSFNVELVEGRTNEVAELLKDAVHRGRGTNGWRIPKFIDMLHLPKYMGRLGSTGRLHVGFAERGLKNWAKKPARTAQKRGGGVFEGQVCSRIRERSMIDHALTQMDSDEEGTPDDEDGNDDVSSMDDEGVGGSCYNIVIERDAPPNQQRKRATCTRLDSRKRVHPIQNDIPITLLHHFKKIGRFGQVIELRTEATIDGTVYRAHPNYRGEGPWYDYATVKFELETTQPPNHRVWVNDNQRYPAKLVAFYRVLPDTEFQVLAHCGEFQARASNVFSRRTLLTRSWLYEVAAGQRPIYRKVGGVQNEVHVEGHLFAIEEVPGFHGRYRTEEDRRFVVLSDMRKVWPGLFINRRDV
jgi:hypothetical protein